MPHSRSRFASSLLARLLAFWPVVGLIGPRQVGKTTLARQDRSETRRYLSLDDPQIREEAQGAALSFLAKFPPPIIIDEVQKAPDLFDAIKLGVDRKRVPGAYLLTGSTSFSSRAGIRESLTGRIATIELQPFCLAEMRKKSFRPIGIPEPRPRFSLDEVTQGMLFGGMPVPAFVRDRDQRNIYWQNWLETTILRDLLRLFKRGYDPDFAFSLLERIGALLREGELPTLKHFSQPSTKVRRYLSAMEELFLLRKIACHELGIGKEVWLLFDGGLAAYLMGRETGEGVTLSLARHWHWNEWVCLHEYQGKRLRRTYYKSAQGSPVDAVIGGVPIRIVASSTAITRQLGYEVRPLRGAMKKLGASTGFIVAPVEHAVDAGDGIHIVPWGAWS